MGDVVRGRRAGIAGDRGVVGCSRGMAVAGCTPVRLIARVGAGEGWASTTSSTRTSGCCEDGIVVGAVIDSVVGGD